MERGKGYLVRRLGRLPHRLRPPLRRPPAAAEPPHATLDPHGGDPRALSTAGRRGRAVLRPLRAAVRPIAPVLRPAGRALRPARQALRPVGRVLGPVGRVLRPAGRALRPAREALRPVGGTVRRLAGAARRGLPAWPSRRRRATVVAGVALGLVLLAVLTLAGVVGIAPLPGMNPPDPGTEAREPQRATQPGVQNSLLGPGDLPPGYRPQPGGPPAPIARPLGPGMDVPEGWPAPPVPGTRPQLVPGLPLDGLPLEEALEAVDPGILDGGLLDGRNPESGQAAPGPGDPDGGRGPNTAGGADPAGLCRWLFTAPWALATVGLRPVAAPQLADHQDRGRGVRLRQVVGGFPPDEAERGIARVRRVAERCARFPLFGGRPGAPAGPGDANGGEAGPATGEGAPDRTPGAPNQNGGAPPTGDPDGTGGDQGIIDGIPDDASGGTGNPGGTPGDDGPGGGDPSATQPPAGPLPEVPIPGHTESHATTQPGNTQPGNTTQPGSTTEPGSTEQSGTAEPGNAAQPGGTTELGGTGGGAERPVGCVVVTMKPATWPGNREGAGGNGTGDGTGNETADEAYLIELSVVAANGRSWTGYLAVDRVGPVLSVLWHLGPRGAISRAEAAATHAAAVAKAGPLARTLASG